MKNQKGFVVPVLLAIIAALIVGGGVYVYNNKKAEAPAVIEVETQQSGQVQQQTNNTSAPITVLSPKAGETYKVGDSLLIKWNDKNGQDVDNYNIALTNSNKLNQISIADNVPIRSSGLDGTSSYAWKVTGVDIGSKYKIEVYRGTARELTGRSGEFAVVASGLTSNWKTYTNTDYGFKFNYPSSVTQVNTPVAKLNLEVKSLTPELQINFNIDHDGIGFADWVNYKKEEVTSFGKQVTINYLKSGYKPDYLFVTVFEQDGRQYMITSRTNATLVTEKEIIFKEFVQSIQRIVMP